MGKVFFVFVVVVVDFCFPCIKFQAKSSNPLQYLPVIVLKLLDGVWVGHLVQWSPNTGPRTGTGP